MMLWKFIFFGNLFSLEIYFLKILNSGLNYNIIYLSLCVGREHNTLLYDIELLLITLNLKCNAIANEVFLFFSPLVKLQTLPVLTHAP